MSRFRNVVLLLVMLSCTTTLHVAGQSTSPRIETLQKEISRFTYQNKFDSAEVLVLEFLDQPRLSKEEIFYGNFLFADVIKSSGKPEEAIPFLLHSKSLLAAIPDSSELVSRVYGNIAECYFSGMKYDSASKYSNMSIATSPTFSSRSGGHAVNYMILGYDNFNGKRYDSAITYFELAIAEYEIHGERCELPLCYTKLARVYNAAGNLNVSETYILKAVLLSDSCGIDSYKLLSKRTQFEIFRENRNYKAALETLLEINDLVEKTESDKRNQSLGELKIKYETQLIRNENESLRVLNIKNEEILAKQKQALVVAVCALIVLTILTGLVIRAYRKRKKAESKLSVLNNMLEQQVMDRTNHLTKANLEITENTDRLIYQNTQLVDFCNIISHNLRSPMRNISTLLSFVNSAKDQKEKESIISKIDPVIQSMNQTFDELLESLQVRQDVEIKSDLMQFEDCLARTVALLDTEITTKGAVIKGNFTDAPNVHYPAKYLHSIFHNLLSNSLKYSSPERKPLIHVESKLINGRVILSFKDNGLGIDLKSNGSKIFMLGKVFHAHPEAKGFGLFITKTQVEAMQGEIRVESEPGAGAQFFIEFAAEKPRDQSTL